MGLWMKRWSCPDCRQIHTLRPDGYQSRILHSLETIRTSLLYKMQQGFFKADGASRQVQQHWWKQLKRWFRGKSLCLDRRTIETHIHRSYHLPVGKNPSYRIVRFTGADVYPYLPFALSTKDPFY